MDESRTLQHARQSCGDAGSTARNGRTILSVPHIACAKFSGTATDQRQSGIADQGCESSTEDLITEAEFAAAAAVVPNINATACTLVPENCNASLAGECVSRQFGRKGIGCDKNMAIAERLVKLSGG